MCAVSRRFGDGGHRDGGGDVVMVIWGCLRFGAGCDSLVVVICNDGDW